MIEPKDGEWWMVEFQSGDKRVMRYWLRDGDSDAVWNVFHDESDSFTTAYSNVKPLYKMVKAEEPKPRTKVVYEPMRGLAVSEAFRAMEDDGDVYVNCCDGSFEGMEGCIINLANAIYDGSVIYRKVGKDIDWRDELDYHIRHNTNIDIRNSIAYAHKNFPEQFIGMCHLVASLTDKPE